MAKHTQQFGLVPYQTTAEPALRRGFLGRLFNGDNGHKKTQMERLEEEHALARRAIQLDADLARCRRQAAHYLEITGSSQAPCFLRKSG